VDAAALRAEFPVCANVAYLNAGTAGPLPRAATEAAHAELERQSRDGRTGAHFDRVLEFRARLRAIHAALLGAEADDIALTTSASDGIVRVLAALPLQPDDEVLTSDEEHPGLLGPLAALARRSGVRVRAAPLADLVDAVRPATRLVACSHVGWATGTTAPARLGELDGVTVLLDGAQGVGAIPSDVRALGCDFYAAGGQKWLCGPLGTGMLYVAPGWRERIEPLGPTYLNLANPAAGLEAPLQPDARRHDAPVLATEACAGALAAHDVLVQFGWDRVHARARELADVLARRLAESGRDVAPRSDTTLVAWRSEDPEREVESLAAAGIVVRHLPGRDLVRASVGAWNDEGDLDRLLAAIAT
jgi:L-cysteine/cystine lyase